MFFFIFPQKISISFQPNSTTHFWRRNTTCSGFPIHHGEPKMLKTTMAIVLWKAYRTWEEMKRLRHLNTNYDCFVIFLNVLKFWNLIYNWKIYIFVNCNDFQQKKLCLLARQKYILRLFFFSFFPLSLTMYIHKKKNQFISIYTNQLRGQWLLHHTRCY